MQAKLTIPYEVVTSWIEGLERLLSCLRYLQEILEHVKTDKLKMDSRAFDAIAPMMRECDPPQCPGGCDEPGEGPRRRPAIQIPVANLTRDLERVRMSAGQLHRAMAKVIELQPPEPRQLKRRKKQGAVKR